MLEKILLHYPVTGTYNIASVSSTTLNETCISEQT